jgi:hypothetical protein
MFPFRCGCQYVQSSLHRPSFFILFAGPVSDISPVATTIYTTVFNNSLADWTLKLIPSAAIGAGLAESRVADLLSAMKSSPATLGELFTADVVLAASAAQQQVYCKAIL